MTLQERGDLVGTLLIYTGPINLVDPAAGRVGIGTSRVLVEERREVGRVLAVLDAFPIQLIDPPGGILAVGAVWIFPAEFFQLIDAAGIPDTIPIFGFDGSGIGLGRGGGLCWRGSGRRRRA